MENGSRVVEVARSWLGTRYAHQGRRKRMAQEPGGVDCLGLLIGIARELDLRDRKGGSLAGQDCAAYSRQPDGIAFRRTLSQLLAETDGNSPPQAGELGLFLFDRNAQHLAIFGRQDYGGRSALTLIHAYAPARKVVEHRYDIFWQRRLAARYRLPQLPSEQEIVDKDGGDQRGHGHEYLPEPAGD